MMLLDQTRLRNAEALVDRAALTGGGRVQFVVNLHAELTPALTVRRYGILHDRQKSWTAAANFRPMDTELRHELRTRLTRAIRHAHRLGLDVAILPHLDAAGEVQEWRNLFDVDPLATHGGYSYATSMVGPVAHAIVDSNTPGRRVWFALSGEMGRSLFTYPDSYVELLATTRRQVLAPSVSLGISLNFRDIAGGASYSTRRAVLNSFLSKCDFVGISCYRPFTPPATPQLFANTVGAFRAELAEQGLNPTGRWKVHLSEIGLGGGDQAGASAAEAAARPWEGMPTGRGNPWRRPDMAALRRDYYGALLDYLDGEAKTVEAAFMWSEGSWEPMGVDAPEYADSLVFDRVRRHNRRATNAAAGTRMDRDE
ncbi:MAG: hypothetical protein AAGB00_06810 [Planctomycetota bacterium]